MDFAELSRGARRALAPAPGWPTRGAVVRDLLLWLGFSLLLLAESYVFSVAGYDHTWRFLVTSAMAGAAIVLSRTYPLLAPCLAVYACTWSQAFMVPLIVVSYLAGRRTRRTWLAIAVFVALCLVMAAHVLIRIEEIPGLWVTVGLALVVCTVLPWLVGVYRRQQAELGAAGWEHARQFQLEQQLTADRARLRERARIAQDMHDSLGHELSLIALRAGALEVSPGLADRHREEIAQLRATAVSATAQLREIIGVLRPDAEPEPAPTAPAGESVWALVERARDSGVDVTTVLPGRVDTPMIEGLRFHPVSPKLAPERGALAQSLDVRRRDVLDGVRLAREQRRGAHRVARQDQQRHPVPRLAPAPVAVVPLELDAAATHEAHELVGAGADGRLARIEVFAGRVRGRLLGDDQHFREVLEQCTVGRRRLEPHGVAVNYLLGDDRPDVGLVAAGTADDLEGTLEREHDILGGELAPVVEPHPFAQSELPRQGIRRAPGGEACHRAALLVGADERVEHVLLGGEIGLRRDEVGIHRGDVGGEANFQLRGVSACGEKQISRQDAKTPRNGMQPPMNPVPMTSTSRAGSPSSRGVGSGHWNGMNADERRERGTRGKLPFILHSALCTHHCTSGPPRRQDARHEPQASSCKLQGDWSLKLGA